MKKNRPKKLTLSRETLRGLDDLRGDDLRLAGGVSENTCFQTCNCKSGDTCYWSECACASEGC